MALFKVSRMFFPSRVCHLFKVKLLGLLYIAKVASAADCDGRTDFTGV